ncbi:hypothetical protein GC173_09485 [bacterium]|nr:hypothetical protein [bacterium]
MSDTYTQITNKSWFSRLSSGLGGIVTGFVLVVVACGALFWNEGRAVKTERALSEGAGSVASIDAATPVADNEGKLVHISGPVSVSAAPVDPLFASFKLPANTIRVSRSVEMYQWAQSSRSEKKKKLGGGEETVTTYSYAKEWSSRRNDSSSFKQPAGHENPDFLVPSGSFTADHATIGAFAFEGATLAGLGKAEKLVPDEVIATQLQGQLGGAVKVTSLADAVIVGRNPAIPAIGDLRISLTATVANEASVIGAQRNNRLEGYTTSGGNTIFLTQSGQVSAGEMFEKAQSANSTMTWLVRAGGLLAMLIGFRMMFSILGVIGDLIPFIGDVFRFATGLASLGLTFVLGPVVIAAAWIAYRPLWGGLILLAGFAAAAVFFRLGRSRAASAKPIDAAA